MHARVKYWPLQIAILLAFSSIYLVNRSPTWDVFNVYLDIAIATLMLGSLIYSLFVNQAPRDIYYLYFLVFICSLISYISGGIYNIHWLYFIISLEIVRLNVVIKGLRLDLMSLSFFLLIILQISIFRFEDGRAVLSIGDPNYSAYYLFIFFIFSYFVKKYIYASIVGSIIIVGLSRAAALSIFLFILIELLRIYFKINVRINKKLYLSVIIFAPILYSILFVASDIDIVSNYTSDVGRLVQLGDQSNMDRSLANIYFIDYLLEVPFSLISGINLDYYTSEIFRNTPHASVYALVFNYGLFYFISMLVAFYRFGAHLKSQAGISLVIISLLPFIVFLGGVLFGPQVIVLSFIINLSRK